VKLHRICFEYVQINVKYNPRCAEIQFKHRFSLPVRFCDNRGSGLVLIEKRNNLIIIVVQLNLFTAD